MRNFDRSGGIFSIICWVSGAICHGNTRTSWMRPRVVMRQPARVLATFTASRSEEHTSELQSLMRISYAVFCLKKKIKEKNIQSLDLHVTSRHEVLQTSVKHISLVM